MYSSLEIDRKQRAIIEFLFFFWKGVLQTFTGVSECLWKAACDTSMVKR